MTKKSMTWFCAGVLVLAQGCATRHVTHERGWIGGGYAGARPDAAIFVHNDWGRVVAGFPDQLRPQYEGGVLVTEVAPETPIARAGIREGDLILAVNGEPTPNVKALRKLIDFSPPGAPLALRVFREGEVAEKAAIVGREKFRRERMIQFGIGFSTTLKFDLIPDPDFSLVALGLDKTHDRLELKQAETEYLQRVRSERKQSLDAAAGTRSPESWRAWIGILSVGGHKKILSQEIVETRAVAEAPLVTRASASSADRP